MNDVWNSVIETDDVRFPLYFPVSCGGMLTTIKKYTPEELIDLYPSVYKKKYSFWEQSEDNYFNHPFYFVSGFYEYPKMLKERCRVDRNKTFTMVDSGGYQLVSGKANDNTWNQKIALEWAEKNATVTPILDYPARAPKGLEYAIDYSAKSAKYCIENRTGECKVLNVISGNSYSMLSRWWEKLGEFQPGFDGVAHGGGNDICSIVEAILILVNDGTYYPGMKPCQHHVFGVSYGKVMIYLSFIQRLLNEMDIPVTISYDSSLSTINIANGKWFSRFDSVPPRTNSPVMENSVNQNETISTRAWLISKYNLDMKEKFTKYKHIGLGCACPVCQGIDDLSMLVGDNYTDIFYLLGSLNNIWHQLNFKKSVDRGIMLGNFDMWTENFPGEVNQTLKQIQNIFSNPRAVDSFYSQMAKLGYKRNVQKVSSSCKLESFF